MPYNTSAQANNSPQSDTLESNVVISTPNLRELPTVLTMDGATQRYEQLRQLVEDYLAGGSSDVISDVKHALYELQDFHKTQLHRVDDLIGRVHQEQYQVVYPVRDVSDSQEDWEDFWVNDDLYPETEPLEHTSEGC
jgi:hypothetical protein|tara:strand:+ start:132 stop:542 length:411 start_codon:yes stop_codon:yes gene_type:complete